MKRYWVALLWHWTPPFVLGVMVSMMLFVWGFGSIADQLDQSFRLAVLEVCKA